MGDEAARPRPTREKTFGWRVVAALAIPWVLLVARFRIRNGEKLPRTGAFVLAPNHYSNLDPVTTGYIVWKLGRVPRFLAKASVFRVPIIGAVLKATGQIPIERTGGSSAGQSLTAAGDLVRHGLAVIVYPEGTLTREPDLWPMRGKSGAVRMALEHDVPLIPMAHWGVQQIMPRYSKKVSLFPRKTVEAIIGDPVDLSRWRGRPVTHELLAEATDAVMAEITRLLEQLRGETAPLERWDPSANGQTETGRF
jgi:1-acyl-sn-glycerol-3-phosphate acyltransferase